MAYDIFISYRREGGVTFAALTKRYLNDRGYNVFLDLECMRVGKFNEQLYDRIDNCKVVLMILPPNALDRCINEDDWVRLEYNRAIEKGKPIIPIMLSGFSFPNELPDCMKELPHYHGIAASDELYDIQLEKLANLIDNYVENSSGKGGCKQASIDIRSVQTFASCGKETSVFKIKKSQDGNEISLDINFEPCRIRKEIPDFAGAYFLFNPCVDITDKTSISMEMYSSDNSCCTVWIELKPKGKAWMHESFCFDITDECERYTIETEDFVNKETLRCLEELTIVIRPESFTDENCLKGTLIIRNIDIT